MELEETPYPDGHEITVTHNDGNSRTTVRRATREECLRALAESGFSEPKPEPPPVQKIKR